MDKIGNKSRYLHPEYNRLSCLQELYIRWIKEKWGYGKMEMDPGYSLRKGLGYDQDRFDLRYRHLPTMFVLLVPFNVSFWTERSTEIWWWRCRWWWQWWWQWWQWWQRIGVSSLSRTRKRIPWTSLLPFQYILCYRWPDVTAGGTRSMASRP